MSASLAICSTHTFDASWGAEQLPLPASKRQYENVDARNSV